MGSKEPPAPLEPASDLTCGATCYRFMLKVSKLLEAQGIFARFTLTDHAITVQGVCGSESRSAAAVVVEVTAIMQAAFEIADDVVLRIVYTLNKRGNGGPEDPDQKIRRQQQQNERKV